MGITLLSAMSDDAIPTAFLANGERYKEWHFISYFGYESSALTLKYQGEVSQSKKKSCSNRERKVAKPGEKVSTDSREVLK